MRAEEDIQAKTRKKRRKKGRKGKNDGTAKPRRRTAVRTGQTADKSQKSLTKNSAEQRQHTGKKERCRSRGAEAEQRAQKDNTQRTAPNNDEGRQQRKRVAERGRGNTCGEKNRATAAGRR